MYLNHSQNAKNYAYRYISISQLFFSFFFFAYKIPLSGTYLRSITSKVLNITKTFINKIQRIPYPTGPRFLGELPRQLPRQLWRLQKP